MKYPFKYVYHCHTKRCGHAQGEDEEYVINAINAGIKVLCFTDHTPIKGFSQKGIRMDYDELEEYLDSIWALKEKYKDKIEIHVGLECEYYPENEEYLWTLKNNPRIEFLIQGQHGALINGQWKWSLHVDETRTMKQCVEQYLDNLIKGMRSGLFKFLAHPDLYMNGLQEMSPFAIEVEEKIIEEAIKNDIILEINGQGVVNGKQQGHNYPDIEFWKLVGKHKDVKVTLGVDAHNPNAFRRKDVINTLFKIKNESGIRLKRKIELW